MKKSYLFFATSCILATVFFVSCGTNNEHPGYKKTKDGMHYRFHRQNPNTAKPKPTDFLKLEMTCYLNDSLYYDWQKNTDDMYAQLSEPKFAGDLMSAYSMLHVGDSASFYIKADSIALLYYDQDPKAVGLGPDDYFRYEMKLLEIMSAEEFQEGLKRVVDKMKAEAKASLSNYIEKEGISVKPSESGVYVVDLEKGKGRCPKTGEKVELDFEARLLDGTFVGSTYDSGEPFSFVLGEGFVIAGWEEVVSQMHIGDKVRAIIPFEMAYNEHSVGNIPSYSNLVYDIKLLKITTKEELARQAAQKLKTLRAEKEKEFEEFVKANQIVDHTASGLYYAKMIHTDGASPVSGKVARIKYVANLMDGTPLGDTEQLGGHYDIDYGKHNVLLGLEEGVGLMKVGEKARFVIPYKLAYGENGYNGIPPCSNLIFDVELVEIRELNN